ncbi:unnamed protein product [Leptidea sinapis]|uniref:Lipocalin/cytosolic fatty-acid binding domain-containing protein n=1 Tax=Leptidea sinapis TaxID=189913 RepID=A0A5E4PR31_9NEOP|nr:unnamed protein product [Leptidea sinapis]
MYRNIFVVSLALIEIICGQVLQFGQCQDVNTVQYFQIDKFLGKWYVIESFPIRYERNAHCSYKIFELCDRVLEIQHGSVADEVHHIIHMNSTYSPGDDAVFRIQANNIDPVGIPLSVVSTDYTNYSVLYGCRVNEHLQLKYQGRH